MTACLQFRHRLLPYIYTMAVRAASPNGEAIVAPMYYDHPNDPHAYKHRNQFMFGTQLLVSAITSPRDKSTLMGVAPTWLPPVGDGKWVDIFSGVIYQGDRIVKLHRALEDYPVLAQQGAIIPLDSGELKNGCPLPSSLEILLVIGRDGSFDLIEEDGTGAEFEDVQFSTTSLKFIQSQGKLVISPAVKPLVENRTWSIRLISFESANVSATVDGDIVDVQVEDVSNGVLVHLGTFSTTKEIILDIGPSPTLLQNPIYSKIYDLLDSFQIGIDIKGEILEVAEKRSKGDGALVTLSRLRGLELDVEVLEALEEIVMADSEIRGGETYIVWDNTRKMVPE